MIKKIINFLIFFLITISTVSPKPLSFSDWNKQNPSTNGKLKADRISRVPEISNLIGIDNKGNLKMAIGIEIFHNRNKPRKCKWKKEIQLSDGEISFGFSRIIVPILNVTVGVFIGKNITHKYTVGGLRVGIFKL
jgi:hypothetical protein